jgi:hypothetical protein
MIAVRFAALAAVTVLLLAAFGATGLQPSALRVAVTAVVGLLAPLFWPGAAPTLVGTALRVAGWSLAAACLAAIALRFAGDGQPLARIFPACAMLMLILLVIHALAAGVERHSRAPANAERSRESAGRTAFVLLALAGSLPLWLGPAAELLARRQAWIIDAVIGVSPLTHLAVASGNDLLRNPWFYQHSNLAALQFSYPGVASLAIAYVLISVALAFVALAPLNPRRPIDRAGPTFPTRERTK